MSGQCVLVFDHWFRADGRGSFTSSGNYSPDALAARYLNSFDELLVLGRCRDASAGEVMEARFPQGVVRLTVVSAKGGATGAARAAARLVRALNGRERQSATILVLPGLLGSLASTFLRRATYGVEMVGDAGEAMSALGKNRVATWLWTAATRRAARRSAGVAYVSSALAARYPASSSAHTAVYSSIQLDPGSLRAESPAALLDRPPYRLVTVARLEAPYKGVDVLVRALARLPEDFHLAIVGGGRLLERYRSLAAELGVDHRVVFHGNLAGPVEVNEVLDKGDIYVQPSLTEGLPRAVIEAMARGLPCLGTRVGGIPQLIDDDWLVSPGSPEELRDLILRSVGDRERLRSAARDNLARAGEYVTTSLQPRRDAFYARLPRRSSTA